MIYSVMSKKCCNERLYILVHNILLNAIIPKTGVVVVYQPFPVAWKTNNWICISKIIIIINGVKYLRVLALKSVLL